MSKFLPTWYCKSIYDIDFIKLKSLNIKYILSDLDNTLVPYDEKKPNENVVNLLEELKLNDIELIVVSNNSFKRIEEFCKPCSLKFLSRACKPYSIKLKKYLSDNNINTNDCAFIGDQLMTDIVCANKIGCTTILVEPLQKKESIFTFFNRKIDKKLRTKYKKQGKLNSINKED